MVLCGLAITALPGCYGGNANDQGSPTPPVMATLTVSGTYRSGLAEGIWLYGVPIARPTEYATIVPFSDGQHVALVVPTVIAEPVVSEPSVQLQPAGLPVQRNSGGAGNIVDWRSLVEQYDDWNVNTMMRIIYGPYPCPNGESGGNAGAISPDGRNWGGLQINVVNYRGDPHDLLTPEVNVRVGHAVWLSQGYGAWSCSPF